MMPVTRNIYQFGYFLLDDERQVLYREGVPLTVQRKLYDILLYLVHHAGELVRKEDLIEHVWQGKEIDERNLTQHIYNLRRLLGDNPRTPSFILTIPAKGYTFNHPIRVFQSTELQALLDQNRPAATPGIRPPGASGLIPGGHVIEEVSSPPVAPLARTRGLVSSLRSKLSRRRLVSALIVLALTIVVMLVTHPSWWRNRQTGSDYPRLTTMTTLSGLKADPSFSPDGRHLAFASGRSGNTLDIYVVSLDQSGSSSPLRLSSHPVSDHDPVWSPDGRQIAFLRGNQYDQTRMQLVVVPSSGGAEKVIASVWGGLDWSPDGRHFAVIDEADPDYPTTLHLITSDGAQRQQLAEPVPGEWRFDSTPRFSPDGRSIAFIRWRGDLDGDIWIVEIQTRQLKQVTFDRLQIADFRWSSDGNEIVYISGRAGTGKLWRQKIGQQVPVLVETMVGDISRFDLHPYQRRLAFTQYSQSTSIELWPLGSGEGNQAAGSRTYPGWICRIDASRNDMNSKFRSDGGRVLTVASSRNYLNPRFSPDGTRLLFVSNHTGMNQIWLANADCSNPTQLTEADFEGLGSPRWSPDGANIVFDGRKSGPAEVFVIESNGANLRVIGEGYMPSWSADGRFIYYVSNRRRLPQVWKAPATGGEGVIVTDNHSRDPLESADGRRLYFSSVDRLWQKDLVTGVESPVPGLENVTISRFWDVARGGIYYVPTQEDSFGLKLHYLDLRTGKVRVLLEFSGIVPRWVPGISVDQRERSVAISYLANVLGDIQILDNWN